MVAIALTTLLASTHGQGLRGAENLGSEVRGTIVPTVGIEPTLPEGKRILSPLRLPFRHVGQ